MPLDLPIKNHNLVFHHCFFYSDEKSGGKGLSESCSLNLGEAVTVTIDA